MSLFWKINIFIAALLIFVIGAVEIIFEPLAKRALTGLYGGFQYWHETTLWAVSIILPSLACSYILSRALTKKLGRMTKVATSIANGNLKSRFSVTGNNHDAFDIMAQSFNAMAEEIEKQMTNERRLMADISHELRSPLTRMNIAIELLPRKHNEDEREKIIQRLHKEIGHMNELVSLLLAQAKKKLLTGDTSYMVNLTEVLRELADDFTFQGKIQNKQVQIQLTSDLRISGNPLLLQRMFSNLLSNAIFYTPPNSSIELTASSSNGNAIVTIRDYGPGVPEEELEDIFRAFYRVDSSRARTSGGAGLGLTLVREAVIAHNGLVEAENVSPGLLVTTVLPLE